MAADKKISELTAADAFTGAETFPVVQTTTKKGLISDLVTYLTIALNSIFVPRSDTAATTTLNKLSLAGTISNTTSLYGAVAITTEHTGSGTGSAQALAVTPTFSPSGASQSNAHGVRSAPIIKSGVNVTNVNSFIASVTTDATTTGTITTLNQFNASNIVKNGSGVVTTLNAFMATASAATAFTNYNALNIANISAGVTGAYKGINSAIATSGVEDRWNLYLSGTAHNYIAGNVLIGTTTETTAAEKLQVTGAAYAQNYASNIVTNTAATYTVLASDSTIIQTTAASTYTLPTASACTGRKLTIKQHFAGTVISNASNVVSLTGSTGTAILSGSGKWATLQSDGSNWQIIASN